MSLQQPRWNTKRALARTYGRYMHYNYTLDKLNRWPLLQDFVQKNAGVPSFSSREAMWSHIANRVPASIDYLEFGVHEGHSILHFAAKNKSPDSRFLGFDTFTGLPEDWNAYKRGHFDTGGRRPQTNDKRVKFISGLFQDTLPTFLATFKTEKRIIVHIDSDLYTSALYCLTKLDAILPNGTILIFDEFGDVLHEFRAATDYIASYRRDIKAICSHDNFHTVAVELL